MLEEGADPTLQRTGQTLDLGGPVGAGVDHRIPVADAERAEVGVAVALQHAHAVRPLGARQAAVEDGDFIAARQRRIDQMAADEAPAADDEPVPRRHGAIDSA
jgi:hypothetical protein